MQTDTTTVDLPGKVYPHPDLPPRAATIPAGTLVTIDGHETNGDEISYHVSAMTETFRVYAVADIESLVETERRTFTARRAEQGFRSQAHLDAFYRGIDHAETCPGCQGTAGSVDIGDGFQPVARRCPEWHRLQAEVDTHRTPRPTPAPRGYRADHPQL